MKKILYKLILLFTISTPLVCGADDGTVGISGIYTGEYRITMLGCPGLCSATSYITLGTGIKDVTWVWDFDEGTAVIQGTTLSVGFDYEVQDIGNEDEEENILYFTDNGDGTYTVEHGFQIYNPNVGSPRKETETTFVITKEDNELVINTIDREIDGSQDGVPGTQITEVFPMTIAPVMNGWARLNGSDSTGGGITDSDKMKLGLNPQVSDSDGDGSDDVDELGNDFSSPIDSDNDGVIDALEYAGAAFNKQVVSGLPLLSGVGGLVTTADSLSGETVNLTLNNGYFKNVSSALMVVDTESATSIDDTAVKDSTLGASGLDYRYGQISILAASDNPNEDSITVQLQYSAPLPSVNLLLVYALEKQDDGREIFVLLPRNQWQLIDQNTLEITIAKTSKHNLSMVPNEVQMAVAPVENSLGGIDHNQGVGSMAWVWVFLLTLLTIFPVAAENIQRKKLVLAGPPVSVSYPLIHMIETGALADLAEDVEFKLWTNPDQLRVLAMQGDVDFIAMPTNVAANLYNRGVPLQLVNVSVWGMLWMISRNPDLKTLADFKGEEIAVPFRADMPDILFSFLAERAGLNPRKNFTVRYTATPMDAMQLLIMRRVDHALLAEPAVSMALRKTHSFPLSMVAPELYRSVDLQVEWGRMLNTEARIPQAGMVVLGKALKDKALTSRLEKAYAESNRWCQSSPQACGELAAKHMSMLTAEAAADSISIIPKHYATAEQARPELETFFQLLLERQSATIGGKLPDAMFYGLEP